MSWVTVIWSMSASACLTLALVHFCIWCKDRAARLNLLFAVMAVLVAVFGMFEFLLMRSTTTAEYAWLHRWGHVPADLLLITLLAFVRRYFGTGRDWLFWLVVGWRLLVLGLNFVSPTSFNFREITALRQFEFLGEIVAVPVGIPTAWARLGESNILLALIFVADAAISLHRRGNPRERRRALFVGGSVLSCIGGAMVIATLNQTGLFYPVPYCASLFFVLLVLAMSYELGQDMLHATELARDLRETEQRMTLATEAANLGIWIRDVVRNEIWASEKWRELFGFTNSERIEVDGFLQRLHPDDRETVRRTMANALERGGQYEMEYRVMFPDSRQRWISSSGRVEYNGEGKPVRVRGVSMDVTRHKQAELEIQLQREELAHLSRVTMLGELSGSLAHELNQPLTAILSNAQAAQRFLVRDDADLDELRAILADIVAEDKRAGEVIMRLRQMLKKGMTQHRLLDLNELVEEALKLMRNELGNHGVVVKAELSPALPAIKGDRVQLQQVLLNVLTNACHAMMEVAPTDRVIRLRTLVSHDGAARVEIEDCGCGIPPENLERIFIPFFTTRTEGMGLGLVVCSNIIAAHGGKLWAANNPDRGATFNFTLPLFPGGDT